MRAARTKTVPPGANVAAASTTLAMFSLQNHLPRQAAHGRCQHTPSACTRPAPGSAKPQNELSTL